MLIQSNIIQIFKLLFGCFIGVLLTVGCQEKTDFIPLDVRVDISSDFIDPTQPNDIFLPANKAIPMRFYWLTKQKIPAEYQWVIRIIGYRGNELRRIELDPDSVTQDNGSEFLRLIRLPSIQEARKIRMYVSLEDKVTGRRALIGSSKDPVSEINVLNAYVLLQETQPQMLEGWYPSEEDETGHTIYWCNQWGKCVIPKPDRRVFFSFKASAPLDCLEHWDFTVYRGGELLVKKTIDQPVFNYTGYVDPSMAGETDAILFTFESNRTFKPALCYGSDDYRTLSFTLIDARIHDYIPLSGFDLEKDQEYQWIRPEAEAYMPKVNKLSKLYVQGRINLDCVPEGQTIRIQLAGKQVVEKTVTHSDFCWEIPVSEIDLGYKEHVPIQFYCVPVFYPCECLDTEEKRPHGIAISEIILL